MLLPLLDGIDNSFVILSNALIAAKFLPFHEILTASLTKSTNVTKPPLLINSEMFTATSCLLKIFCATLLSTYFLISF